MSETESSEILGPCLVQLYHRLPESSEEACFIINTLCVTNNNEPGQELQAIKDVLNKKDMLCQEDVLKENDVLSNKINCQKDVLKENDVHTKKNIPRQKDVQRRKNGSSKKDVLKEKDVHNAGSWKTHASSKHSEQTA